MALLSAHNLSVTKRDRLLFDEINFSIEPSGLLYIKGPNGAGKTSLLRILVGLVESDMGEVQFKGSDIRNCRSEFHHELIYFGHKLGINGALNAIENLQYWCKQHGVIETSEYILSVLEKLGLVGLEDIPVSHLSAGQQRRVALARFWLKQQAKLWVLDEPFTALDTQGISLLSRKIVSYLTGGGAVIMTSHQALELNYPTNELALEYRI